MARGNGDGAREWRPTAAHAHGSARTRGGPVAELPLEVPPPAPHRAVPKERTGVPIPPADGDGAGEGGPTAAHPHGGRRTRPARPGPERPLAVLSPALPCVVPMDRPGVFPHGRVSVCTGR